MDVNDIESRLKRLYVSIGLVIIQEHDNLVSFSNEQGEKPGISSVVVHMGPKDEDAKWLLVENVISALARLKDNLKKRMISLEYEDKLVEDEIDKSLVLQLIFDLDNAFKHGYPTNRNRSKKNPKLTNLTAGIRVYGTSSSEETAERVLSDFQNGTVTSGARITFDLENNTQSYKAAEDTKMIINAEVVDEHMNFILYLDDMIEDSILRWEMFIAKHKLKSP
jgi:hypothetical protein